MSDEPLILATAGYENVIKLWQAHSAQLLRQLEHPGSQVNALSISPDRRSLAAGGYEHIRLYDIADQLAATSTMTFDMQKNVTAVGFDANGKWMYSGGEDTYCRVWDLRTARANQANPCSRLFQVNGPITSVCLHPNQIELFVGDTTGTVYIWDLRNNKSSSLIPDPNARIQSVAVNVAGTYLAALANTGSCFLWSLASAAVAGGVGTQAVPKARIAAHSGYGLGCKFSPDSTLLATCGSDRVCNVWKTSDYQKQVELSGAEKWVWDCAFSADSEFVVTVSSDGCARLYSLGNGAKARREYRSSAKSHGHGASAPKPMTCLAFVDDTFADES